MQLGAQKGQYNRSKAVRNFYDLVNESIRLGWNDSLHFAPLTPEETLEESITRHQRLMIDKLKLQKGRRVLDVGCGVGGPMRRVAREAGMTVLCLNKNTRQLEKTRIKNIEHGLVEQAEYLNSSFMNLSAIEENSLDAAYALESTCYAPDKVHAFAEIYRVLKPGALFWGQEMCLTQLYNVEDQKHRWIEEEIRFTLELKELFTFDEVNGALESVGFEIIEAENLAEDSDPRTPWYKPMQGSTNFSRLLWGISWVRRMQFAIARLAEMTRLLPKGVANVFRQADRIAQAFVAGGESGIYTPLYCFLARKTGEDHAYAEVHPKPEPKLSTSVDALETT